MANAIDVFTSTEFVWALGLGSVCWLAVVALTGATAPTQPLRIGGILISAVTAVVITGRELPGGWALVGLALLGLLPFIASRLGLGREVVAAASLPGAVVLALAAPVEPAWVRPAVILGVPFLGYVTCDFESRYESVGLGVIFYGLAAAGTFLSVPETDGVRVLLGACLPISLLAWPRVRVALGTPGTYMAMGLFVVLTATGGAYRPASIVGALACLGFLLLEPMMVRARSTVAGLAGRIDWNPVRVLVASGAQFALVLVCSRVAARFTSVSNAAIVVFAAFAVSWATLAWVDRRSLPAAGARSPRL